MHLLDIILEILQIACSLLAGALLVMGGFSLWLPIAVFLTGIIIIFIRYKLRQNPNF